jgi:hypothetical protein
MGVILIAVVISIGACAALVWRYWQSDARIRAPDTISTGASASGRASPGGVSLQERSLNPAAQKAGPPDPEAMKTAARSAEDAARAAAELATK